MEIDANSHTNFNKYQYIKLFFTIVYHMLSIIPNIVVKNSFKM